MSNVKAIESLQRVRKQIQEKLKEEGLSEKVKLLKMLEELIIEQVTDENSRRSISPTR